MVNKSSMWYFVMLFCLIIVLVNSISISSRSYIGFPSDCGGIDIKKGSGVYMIYPEGVEDGFNAYCNMETDNVGSGWTIFQKRQNGEVDVYRRWNDYKFGFGTLDGEHWLELSGYLKICYQLFENRKNSHMSNDSQETVCYADVFPEGTGNEHLHILTSKDKNELLITMEDNHTGYAKYANFKMMTISSYTGNVGIPTRLNGEEDFHRDWRDYKAGFGTLQGEHWLGDSFSYHSGMKFCTKDKDNDVFEESCAVNFKGGWWYGSWHSSNLNGLYHAGDHTSNADGVNWKTWKGQKYSLKETTMMIRQLQ